MDRDKSHEEQINRWAKYVKTHAGWKKQHAKFINSQIEIAERALKKIVEMPSGKERIKMLREIRKKSGGI